MKNLLLFIVLLVSFRASAQQWYSSPAPHGRDINTIKIIHPDIVVVAGGWQLENSDSSRAIFLSENGGLYLWNVPPAGDGFWITSIDFTDSENGIGVCTQGGIIRTSDGGWNWTNSSTPLNRDLNKIFLIDDQNMIIAGGNHGYTGDTARQTIFKSTDGGQSWNVMLDQPGFWLKSVYFPTPTTGYAVGDSGTILKTTNGGVNWSPVTAPIQRNFNSIWFTDANNGFIAGGYPVNDSITTLLQTTNGGNTWTIKIDQAGNMLRDIHFHDTSTGYAVGDDATVLKTTDAGQTWNPVIIPGTFGDEQFNAVRFYSDDFGYVSGKWGVQFIYNEEAAPQVFTSSATLSDSLSVTLTGFVNSMNEIAAHKFVYSADPTFGVSFQTAYGGIIKNNTPEPVQETFYALLPDTQYYYFIYAWTLAGTVYGDTLTFHTANAGSQITTLYATNITQNEATLHGTIKGFSIPMDLFFEYGTSPAFGNQVAATPATVNDTALQSVSANISSLQSDTVYYFRMKGVSGNNNYYGNTLTFYSADLQTLFTALQTLPATNINDTSAVLNALVDGFKIPADISFQFDTDNTSFNHSTGVIGSINDTALHTISSNIFDLIPTTLYYFRVKAQTALGTFYGDTLQFYSGFTGNYSIQTKAATDVVATSAQLHGTVSGFNEPADLGFEYDTTLAMNNSVSATPASISDTAAYDVSAMLTGLQPNTAYYYRLTAQIPSGAKVYGDIRQLYTGASGIPNWDFQNWEQKTYTVPAKWNIIGEDFERVPGRSGNYALKISNLTLAILGTLYDHGGTEVPSFLLGVPFRARPDSIAFYAHYDIMPGDSALFLIHLYDTAFNDISTGIFLFGGSSNGQFKKVSFPISYNSGLMPDSIVVAFIPTVPEGVPNSNFVIIDDLHGISASPVIEGGDFENWIDISNNVLLEWFYPKNVTLGTAPVMLVTQALFNAPDDYAAELQNFPLGNGLWIGTEISTRLGTFDKSFGGFPVYARHQSLNGYFKWLPDGDTLSINIQMRYHGQEIGYGQFNNASPVTEFTMFDLPITYTVPGVIPDTAEISIRCYHRPPARGDSHVFIDKLSFDGFVGVQEPAVVHDGATAIKLYPNPAAAEVTIRLSKEIRKGKLTVYDLRGTAIYSESFSGSTATMNTGALSKGLYLVSIEEGNRRVTTRLIVVHEY